jgi:hypothetical protein
MISSCVEGREFRRPGGHKHKKALYVELDGFYVGTSV